MPTGIPAIVLSGGSSNRLGQPKALVSIQGKSLLSLAIKKLQHAGCMPVVVVVNKNLQYDALIHSHGATIVVNKTPQNGRTGSLKIGLNSLIAELGRVPNQIIMCPIDRPGWKSSHIGSLVNSGTSSCLVEDGKKGHPVSLVKDDLLNILGAPDDASLRSLVDFSPVEIDNGLLWLNIDTPVDLEKLADNSNFFDEL